MFLHSSVVPPVIDHRSSVTAPLTYKHPQLLVQDMKIVEGIAPEFGAYFNEVSHPRLSVILQPTRFLFLRAPRYEFNWKKSFFSSHYDKFRAIKQKHDPSSMFLGHEGIESDEWNVDIVCPV